MVRFLNPTIYSLGKRSSYAADMHDIVSGCKLVCPAVPGFDLATGWGTPNSQPVVSSLTSTAAARRLRAFVVGKFVYGAGWFQQARLPFKSQADGFTGSVALSVSGLPTGVTGTFGASERQKAALSTLTLTAASGAASGTSALTIQGTSGTLTSQVGLSLQVTGIAGYTLNTSAATVSIVQAGTASAVFAFGSHERIPREWLTWS